MAEAALKEEVVNARPLRPEGIALTGMGGSGIVCDFTASILEEGSEVPVEVLRGLEPPSWVGPGWLVVAVSYSGGTLETLSLALKAARRGAWMAAVSSGGRLMEYAKQHGCPYVKVEEGYAPRSAMPMLLYATLSLLAKLGVEEALKGVEEGLEALRAEEAEGEGLRLAEFLEGWTPLIVADSRLAALAWRFKSELNENAKLPAKCEVVPESMHNDVEAYREAARSFRAVVLSACDDTAYTRVLEGFVAELMEEVGLGAKVLKLRGRGRLAKLLYGSHVAGFTSLHLASRRGVDPAPIQLIKRYRSFLESTLASGTWMEQGLSPHA
jgi:glucose/mannose-6-phosphate isomerase